MRCTGEPRTGHVIPAPGLSRRIRPDGNEAMRWAILRNVLGEDPVPVAFRGKARIQAAESAAFRISSTWNSLKACMASAAYMSDGPPPM